ncbi:AmmeMemoRadiSam system protein A [bacterium]|nr:AmmeMemoRadiSam system protein A [bacterium]
MSVETELTEENRRWLLNLARRTLEALPPRGGTIPGEADVLPGPVPLELRDKQGAFVTLHHQGDLRGCIGYVVASIPLYRVVLENTVNAARKDPRFPPLETQDLPGIEIEISVLSKPRKLEDRRNIEVGRHGLIVSRGLTRGLLLPQVASEYAWSPEEFLSQTCRKAGLPMDAWKSSDVEIEVFSAQVFSENKPAHDSQTKISPRVNF